MLGQAPSFHALAPFPPVGGAWVIPLKHAEFLGSAADAKLPVLAFGCIPALIV